EADEEHGRQCRPGDPAGDGLAAVDGDAEVTMEDAVRAAAEERREDVRHAGGADEHAEALTVGVAGADPAAVLDRDRLIEAPGLLEVLLVLEGHAWVVGEPGGRAAPGGEQGGVHGQGEGETKRDGL